MAKTNTNISYKDMGGLSFDKPAEVLKQLIGFNDLLKEATPEQQVELKLSMNACLDTLVSMLTESFPCSEDNVKEVLTLLPINTGRALTVTHKKPDGTLETRSYSGSYTSESSVELDKTWLSSQGFKNQTDYYRDLVSKGQPIPNGLIGTESLIVKFVPDKWDGQHPIGKSIDYDKVELKIKKMK